MRILVVDDHLLVRDGIISLLVSAGHDVIGECGDGRTAVRLAGQLRPDAVLMDICMTEMNGLEALKLIKARIPQIKVVMLTITEEEKYVMQAIQLGADGYMLKSASGDEFLECLHALEMGNLALNQSMATRVIQGLMESQMQDGSLGRQLTERELEILTYVAEGQSNKNIGKQLTVSENTIKYHLKKILQKLDAQNRTEAVARAIHLGYLERELV